MDKKREEEIYLKVKREKANEYMKEYYKKNKEKMLDNAKKSQEKSAKEGFKSRFFRIGDDVYSDLKQMKKDSGKTWDGVLRDLLEVYFEGNR